MADKIYVVTLKKKDDLDGFYSDMESDGFKLQMKRPISRNTHYYMTDDQAVALRDDSRVLAVACPVVLASSPEALDIGPLTQAVPFQER